MNRGSMGKATHDLATRNDGQNESRMWRRVRCAMLVCMLERMYKPITALLGRMNKRGEDAPTTEAPVPCSGRREREVCGFSTTFHVHRTQDLTGRSAQSACGRISEGAKIAMMREEVRVRTCWRLTSNTCEKKEDLQKAKRASKGAEAEAAIGRQENDPERTGIRRPTE